MGSGCWAAQPHPPVKTRRAGVGVMGLRHGAAGHLWSLPGPSTARAKLLTRARRKGFSLAPRTDLWGLLRPQRQRGLSFQNQVTPILRYFFPGLGWPLIELSCFWRWSSECGSKVSAPSRHILPEASGPPSLGLILPVHFPAAEGEGGSRIPSEEHQAPAGEGGLRYRGGRQDQLQEDKDPGEFAAEPCRLQLTAGAP